MFPLHTGQPISPGRRDAFAALALVYLLLPSLVFLLTWIQPGIGVPVAIVTALSCLWFLRRNFRCEARRGLSGTDWFCILVLAGAWTWLAGIGGWAPQVSDYEKHNLVFHDLLQQSWPVTYQTGGEGNFLCYGMGYYLAPAWLARALGVGWLPTATFVWGWAGVALFFYWVATFGGLAKKGLIVFLCFATTETLWHMFLHLLHAGPLGSAGHGIDSALDHMGIRADYSDTLMSLQYRPQHVISAWLGCALFYELFWVRRSARGAALVWAACVFWSPLMSLGLLLIPVVALGRWRWRDALEPANLGGAVWLVVLAIYFQGHVPLMEQGPIWKFAPGPSWMALYPWFLLLELIPLLLIFLADWQDDFLGELRPLFVGGCGLLLVLPLYKIGYYGDQRLQAATPALVFAGLAAARWVQSGRFSVTRPLFILLVASQLAGAAYPFAKWARQSLGTGKVDYSYEATRLRYGYQNISDFKRDGYDYASQYLGRANSLAGRCLLRKTASSKEP